LQAELLLQANFSTLQLKTPLTLHRKKEPNSEKYQRMRRQVLYL
jgi:hypothetical protein